MLNHLSRILKLITASLTLTLLTQCSEAEPARKPNFVWIVSEDNSLHYLDHFFDGGAKAPNIEALAENGLTYRNAYSNSPVCSVARTTLATASYGPRIGTQYHRRTVTADLPDDLRLFQTYLHDAGYYTANHAKTDYNVTLPQAVWDDSSNTSTWRNRTDKDQPFFYMQSFADTHESRLHFEESDLETVKTVHDPATVKLEPYLPDTKIARYTHARYLDAMVTIDDHVGNIIADLKEDGLLEDTFIFYFGDHGGVLPRGKGYAYDTGLHVPLVIRIPENFKHLVDAEQGASMEGFVDFVDFGPTVLELAGVDGSHNTDGRAFLGQSVDMDEVNSRDESFGYADRFDEKYDLVRTLRKGKFHYMRNYQPHLMDGLRNNYRFRMAAYREWRDLYKAGELNAVQSQFFEPKAVEALYDLEADPYSVNNLAGDPAYADMLRDMRHRMQQKMKSLPDLSFYTESYLVKNEVFSNATLFGQSHKAEIASMIDTADLALLDYSQAKPKLIEALGSENTMIRLWAVNAATSFGETASDLARHIIPLKSDASLRVRLKVADYMGVSGTENPQKLLAEIINTSDEHVLVSEALNSVVLFNEHFGGRYPLILEELKPIAEGAYVTRRMNYLKDPDKRH